MRTSHASKSRHCGEYSGIIYETECILWQDRRVCFSKQTVVSVALNVLHVRVRKQNPVIS